MYELAKKFKETLQEIEWDKIFDMHHLNLETLSSMITDKVCEASIQETEVTTESSVIRHRQKLFHKRVKL